jgi:hypothetical protein
LWIENSTHFERYGLYGDLSSPSRPEELAARIVTLRNELHPFFDRIESNDPSIRTFFHRFPRVWIIQSPNHTFVKPTLESYLNIKDKETTGSLLVISSEAK